MSELEEELVTLTAELQLRVDQVKAGIEKVTQLMDHIAELAQVDEDFVRRVQTMLINCITLQTTFYPYIESVQLSVQFLLLTYRIWFMHLSVVNWFYPSKQNYITGILLQYYLLLCIILVRHIMGTSRRKTRHLLI